MTKLSQILLAPLKLLTLITGRIRWTPPAWMPFVFSYLNRHRKYAALLMILAGIGVGIHHYVDGLPKKVKVLAKLTDIKLTGDNRNSNPSQLEVTFVYDYESLNEGQLRPEGAPSVAKIDLIGKVIESGITLKPAKKGQWKWLGDSYLTFIPDTDWPAGVKYQVSFSEPIFTEQTVLSQNRYSFETPAFGVNFKSTEFYQDPTDSSVRRVVSTLSFSHPVDKESLEENLRMGLQAQAANSPDRIQAHPFSVSYSKDLREAYITSEPVALPKEPNYMKLIVEHGVKSLLGGSASRQAVDSKVLVPDIYSYLKVTNVSTQIVRNTQNEPEQLLMLEFTDEIEQQELLSKLRVYQLSKPIDSSARNRDRRPRLVNEAMLLKSKKLDVSLIPNERSSAKHYSFVIDVPEWQDIYVLIESGLTSVNEFVQSSPYDEVVAAPAYPREVTIAGEGAVLTQSGNHQLSVLSRGVSALRYSVGKLRDQQINHLVSQTRGDITNPSFHTGQFNEENLIDVSFETVQLETTHPRKTNYSSFDLTQYLPEDKNRFGLFFVEVSGSDKNKKRATHPKDKRLILVTDLGIIVKDNTDTSHHVFVQSIASGEPVAGASVQLLGRNGAPISSTVTDDRGQAFFAPTYGYKREQLPTVYVVKTDDDISFIPFQRSERQINLSKFDIGGVRSGSTSGTSIEGFVFSDRGIYRPGETVNLGLIAKNQDLSNIEGIPLELVIYGPKNNELKVSRYTLPDMGFSDFQFQTDSSSDTGPYSASLHLVSERGYRDNQIGSTRFSVEEFQPDTMKILSRLEGVSETGWNIVNNISASVSLSNLFGTPAQDRKVNARLIVEPQAFDFSKFENYHFSEYSSDNQQKTLRVEEQLPEQKTDKDGKVKYDIDLSRFQNGTYRTQLLVEGFDQTGGRSVRASSSVLTSPLTQLIGYKANGNLNYIAAQSERSISFIAVDHRLEKQLASDLSINLIRRQQVSTLIRQANGTYKYQTIEKESAISTAPLSIPKTGFEHLIDSATPGDFAVEIRDSDKQLLSRVEYSVAGFANLSGKLDKNAELKLTLDKQEYMPGDSIKMSLKAPYSGAGLITIETDKVHAFKWFKTNQQSTVQEIALPHDIDGTAYVNVAFVRDASAKEIFTSPLSYAVQPLSVDKGRRRVDIDLETAELVRPGKAMPITFSTSRPAKIAIFAIDEGILQVANYNTPDPLAHYLKKRALGVETLQMLDLILPDFELVKQLSASGGGSRARNALAKNLNPFKRKTDKPAVFWSGIYDASNTSQQIDFVVPNSFAGELRIMAVAVSEEAVGASSRSSLVRGPFVISPNTLTNAAPGDEFEVTVGVANIIENSGKGVPVELSVVATDNLELIGEPTSTLTIDEGSEAKHTFRVRAKQKLGAAELTFTAKHGNEELFRTAGLSVRPAMTYYTSFDAGVADNGKLDLPLTRHLYPNLAKQAISASASPMVVIDGLTSYLDTYPHGCTEQVVSKVFPIIGLLSQEMYAPHLSEVNESLSVLIGKLRSRQLANGGFAFWPGGISAGEYPSIYVMHFLIEAQELGYAVPSTMLSSGKRYLEELSQSSTDSSLLAARNRANAIYLLTRMGTVSTNYLIDLEEELIKRGDKQWHDNILSSYMAATHKLLQNDKDADRLIKNYRIASKHDRAFDDFNSVLATDAQHLLLLSKHFPQRAEKLDSSVILDLTNKIFEGEYNTISAAYSVLALGEYSKIALQHAGTAEDIAFEAIDGNKKHTSLSASMQPFLTANYSVDTKKVKAQSDEKLFYLNVQSGFDLEAPDQAIKQGIEIHREFVDEDGKVIKQLEVGKEATVRVKVRSLDKAKLTNIAIVDLLPGGFEIVRESVRQNQHGHTIEYIDIREDRVVFYGNISRTVTELSYTVKLTSVGNFIVPPSYAESMYDRSIRAITKASKFEVIATP